MAQRLVARRSAWMVGAVALSNKSLNGAAQLWSPAVVM